MKKLLLGLTLLASMSTYAGSDLVIGFIEDIEESKGVACSYVETSKPCLTNLNCRSVVTYSCDIDDDKQEFAGTIKVAYKAKHVGGLFEIGDLESIKLDF